MNCVRHRLSLLLCAACLLWAGGSSLSAQTAPEQPQTAQAQPVQPQAAEGQAAQAPPGSPETGVPFQPAQPEDRQAAEPPQQPAQAQEAQAEPAAQAPQPSAAQAPQPPAPQEEAERPGNGEWEKGALENVFPDNPTRIRVVVLNAPGQAKLGGMVAFLLEEYRRKELERKIGKKIAVVNTSSLTTGVRESIIFYRPGHLRAALIMADVIPGKQAVRPMVPNARGKIGIDVEIRLGREAP